MTQYVYHNGIAYAKDDDIKEIEKSEKKKRNEKHDKSFALLQAAVCAAVILAFLILKAIGGEIYEKVSFYYREHMYSSVIAAEDEQAISEKIGDLLDASKEKS